MAEHPWDLTTSAEHIARFNSERQWGSFHNPKNLVMALAGEVGELAAEFQWLAPEEAEGVMSTEGAAAIEDEVADVAIYLITLAERLGINLRSAVEAKVQRNRSRFPITDLNQNEGTP